MFLYRNCDVMFRNDFFHRLSKYKFVHAPGVCEHNFDDPDLVRGSKARVGEYSASIYEDRIRCTKQ